MWVTVSFLDGTICLADMPYKAQLTECRAIYTNVFQEYKNVSGRNRSRLMPLILSNILHDFGIL